MKHAPLSWLMLAALLVAGQNVATWCALGHSVDDHAAHGQAEGHEHDGACRLCAQLGASAPARAASCIGTPVARCSLAPLAAAVRHTATDGPTLPGARAPPA